MKYLFSFLIIVIFAVSCGLNSKSEKIQSSELSDTLQYKTIVLKVEGMTCEGCEMTIQKTIGKLNGIQEVTASHARSQTTLIFDTSKANVVLISEMINDLGYNVVGEIPLQ